MSLILNTLQDLSSAIAQIGGAGSNINAAMLENLKSSAFARAFGDATKRFKVANPVSDNDAVNLQSLKEIGIDQKYYDETANRSVNITYKNTTKKPILILLTNKNTSNYYFLIDGDNVSKFSSSGNLLNSSYIIPPDSTYMLSGGTIELWIELK